MSKNIVVVDDEPEMEFFYAQMLEDLTLTGEVNFYFFSDSIKFYNWSQQKKVDLLLTDINMPQLSGLDLIRKIKNNGQEIMAYLVSGFDERSYSKVMKELEIRRFLEKPLDFEQILKFIQLDLDLK